MAYLLISDMAAIFISSEIGLFAGFCSALILITGSSLLIKRCRGRHDFARIVWSCALAVVGFLTGFLAVVNEDARAFKSIAILQGSKLEVTGVVRWVYDSPYGKQYVIGGIKEAGKGNLFGSVLIDANSGAFPKSAEPGDRIAVSMEIDMINGAENPGGFDARSYWFLKGVIAKGHSLGIVSTEKGKTDIWTEAAFDFAGSFKAFTEQAFGDADERALIDAIALSDKSGMEAEEASAFKSSGMSHLMSASGLHISIIIGVLLWVMERIRVPSMLKIAIILPILPIYVIAAGARASILRAFLMGSFSLFCGALKVKRPGLSDFLALAAFIQLLWSPASLFDPGFQMSYIAIGGLICSGSLTTRKPEGRLSVKIARSLLSSLRVSFFITAAMLPILMSFYGSMSVLSPFANIVAVPSASAALAITLASYLLGLIYLPLGLLAANLARPFLEVLILLAKQISAAGFALIPTGTTPGLSGVAYYSVVGFSWLVHNGYISFRRTVKSLHRIAPAVAAILVCALLLSGSGKPDLKVRVLSVGQGDSILVTYGDGFCLLFDTGPGYRSQTAMESRILPALRSLGVDRIDALILTHGHSDHTSGLLLLSESIRIGRVIVPAGDLAAVSAARQAHIEPMEATAGDTISNGHVTVTFLNPERPLRDGADLNEGSLVAAISTAGHTVLLEADAGFDFEESYRGGKVEFLKVGHHGAATSCSTDFLLRSSPEFAAISVGKNMYGHPSPMLLQRLGDAGALIMRTDQEGMVEVSIGKLGAEISRFSDKWSSKPFFRVLASDKGSRINPAHAVK